VRHKWLKMHHDPSKNTHPSCTHQIMTFGAFMRPAQRIFSTPLIH
jgi:hypothetical protein